MQEKRIGLSPYCYTSNNPVNRIDPNGMLDDWIEDVKTNKIEWKDNITSASQTPEGYRYVGKNEKDILYHLTYRLRMIQNKRKLGVEELMVMKNTNGDSSTRWTLFLFWKSDSFC